MNTNRKTVTCKNCGADNTKEFQKKASSGFGVRHIACWDCGEHQLKKDWDE